MTPSFQLNLPPSEVQTLSREQESAGKKVDGVALMHKALLDTEGSQVASAITLGVSESAFSQQYSWNYPDKHPSLKKLSDRANRATWRRFAVLLCAELGLSIAGPDEERHALADVADAMARYLRVRR
jgi:hypothetical protein